MNADINITDYKISDNALTLSQDLKEIIRKRIMIHISKSEATEELAKV